MAALNPSGLGQHNLENGASERPKVLFLDDDKANLDAFKANFRDQFDVFLAQNPVEAYNIVQQEQIEVVITDHNMPSMTGLEFLESIAQSHPEVPRILITGYTELVSVVEAVNKGKVFRIITKPFNLPEIKSMVLEAWVQFRLALEKDKTIRQLTRQNQQFEFILRQRLLS